MARVSNQRHLTRCHRAHPLHIAGADQELDVQSAEELYEMTDGERRLLAVDGSQEHGVALLDQEIWLSDEIVEWFSLALTPQD